MSKKIARVFPRRTKASPTDEYAFFDTPGLFLPEIDEVHISVAFTYDMPRAEMLAQQWESVAPTKIGGPATGMPGGDFEPGEHLRFGYTITSRGCNNSCWFCQVWRREGKVRELPIREGNIILDDNLLQCSARHFLDVMRMLKRQAYGRPAFTGGLEAAMLKEWHCKELFEVKTKEMFFAYDTPNDYDPLVEAGKMLIKAGFTVASHALRTYVLIGYPRDTFVAAEMRLRQAIAAGFMPMAMLYRDNTGCVDPKWVTFQRHWANRWFVGTEMKRSGNKKQGRLNASPFFCAKIYDTQKIQVK